MVLRLQEVRNRVRQLLNDLLRYRSFTIQAKRSCNILRLLEQSRAVASAIPKSFQVVPPVRRRKQACRNHEHDELQYKLTRFKNDV